MSLRHHFAHRRYLLIALPALLAAAPAPAQSIMDDAPICSIEWNRRYDTCSYNILSGNQWATVSRKTVGDAHECLDLYVKQARANHCALYLKECNEESQTQRCVQGNPVLP